MIDSFDFGRLKSSEHMLQWLAADPIATLQSEFSAILNEQVPGSTLLGLQVRSDPEWLTGAIPTKADPSKAVLARTGVAFEFALSVRTPDRKVYDLVGVFSWVGVHLNDPAQRKQRTWFDLNGNLSTFGAEGELKSRLYFA
jgi:hypothetical protein